MSHLDVISAADIRVPKQWLEVHEASLCGCGERESIEVVINLAGSHRIVNAHVTLHDGRKVRP